MSVTPSPAAYARPPQGQDCELSNVCSHERVNDGFRIQPIHGTTGPTHERAGVSLSDAPSVTHPALGAALALPPARNARARLTRANTLIV